MLARALANLHVEIHSVKNVDNADSAICQLTLVLYSFHFFGCFLKMAFQKCKSDLKLLQDDLGVQHVEEYLNLI